MEQAYFSSEVAKSLGIGASTLRKYALALEEAGYQFDRGINNSRVFYQHDVITVQRIVSAINNQNLPLETAIKLAVEHQQQPEQPVAVPAPPDSAVPYQATELLERVKQLEANQEKLIEVNRELVKELAMHQQWMKKKLEEQDVAYRDRALLSSLEQKRVERIQPEYKIPSLFSSLWRRIREA
ncbi:MAG TPA: hypothetical protein VEY51_15690 [Chondromyces sp.]|nr:hypothetical protein [Chondromyces sp.]